LGRYKKVFGGGIKSSITILTSLLPHKKFTWSAFGRVYIPHIPPCRYAPAEYLKKMGWLNKNHLHNLNITDAKSPPVHPIGIGDGRQGGHVPSQIREKIFFGQLLCKIWAFSGKNHV